jgi:release factor glutamine methyltransferase
MRAPVVAEVLRDATGRLSAAGIAGAARDARLLLGQALGIAPDRVTLTLDERLDAASARAFDAMVRDRLARRPVAQILGRRRFWGRDFAVTGDVLDPRPETETLVALALEGRAPASILDLGTGSGAILLTLLAEWPDARGVGIDASEAALAVARRNADALGVAARVRLERGDWLEGADGRHDLVVCNPPYVAEAELDRLDADVRRWEPRAALTAGPTGLESYRAIAPRLGGRMAPAGRALFEIGIGQTRAVAAIFAEAGLIVSAIHRDLDGRERVVELAAPN